MRGPRLPETEAKYIFIWIPLNIFTKAKMTNIALFFYALSLGLEVGLALAGSTESKAQWFAVALTVVMASVSPLLLGAQSDLSTEYRKLRFFIHVAAQCERLFLLVVVTMISSIYAVDFPSSKSTLRDSAVFPMQITVITVNLLLTSYVKRSASYYNWLHVNTPTLEARRRERRRAARDAREARKKAEEALAEKASGVC